MSKEKRKPGHGRKAISLVVDYDGATDLYHDFTENLSSGGTFVHTDRSFEIGDTINLQLSFPRLLAPLSILGAVRWVRNSEEGNGVGIEFIDFDDSARQALEQVLGKIRESNPNYVQPTLRMLLVEDNPHITRLIRESFGSGRYTKSFVECVAVNDGEKALEFLGVEVFDVAVIDINLPGISGPEVIAHIRQKERTKDLAIIAVSAGGDAVRDVAMQAGADFFLFKPMRIREIIETMRELLDTV